MESYAKWTRTVAVMVSPEIYDALHKYAEENQTSIGSIIRKAIVNELKISKVRND